MILFYVTRFTECHFFWIVCRKIPTNNLVFCVCFYLYGETANQLSTSKTQYRYRKCVLLFYNITSSFLYFSPPTMLLVMDRFPESSKNFIFKLKSRTSLFYSYSFDKYFVFWKIFRRPEIWVSGNWSVTTKMQFTLTFINHKNTKDLLTENVRYYTID